MERGVLWSNCGIPNSKTLSNEKSFLCYVEKGVPWSDSDAPRSNLIFINIYNLGLPISKCFFMEKGVPWSNYDMPRSKFLFGFRYSLTLPDNY